MAKWGIVWTVFVEADGAEEAERLAWEEFGIGSNTVLIEVSRVSNQEKEQVNG